MTKMGFYTTQEVANMLNISKKTLYRWEAAKKIPKAKRYSMNKWRIYTEEDVKKLKKIVERS